MKSASMCTLLCVIAFNPFSAKVSAAEEHLFDTELKLKPALLHGATDNRYVPAARFRGRLAYDYAPWRGASAFTKIVSEGTLATDSDVHSENIFAEWHLGGAWQLQKNVAAPPPPLGARDPHAPATNPPPTVRRWGRLEVSGKVRFETDQPFDNYALTYGPELGYFHNNWKAFWPLVPSLYVNYQRVEVLHSEQYEQLGLDEDSFYRLSTVASWDIPFGEKFFAQNRYLSPLGAIVNLRYSVAHEISAALARTGKDQAWYWEAGLNYELSDLGIKWLRNAYVTVARGRQLPVVENKTMVFIGFVVGWE